MEQVFVSHLRVAAESMDQFVKTHARECKKQTNPKDTIELFENLTLKPVPMDTFVPIVQKWIAWVALQVSQPDPKLANQVLGMQIWRRFITRMSINKSLICSVDNKPVQEGFEILNLFIEVCRDIVYTSFKMEVMPVEIQKPVENTNRFTSSSFAKPQSKQFTTLFESSKFSIPEAKFSLPSIEEENPVNSDSELLRIRNGTAFAPKIETSGTVVKIRRRNPSKETSSTEKKKPARAPRKSKAKKRASSSDSESE
jgi:hypothetical protein